MIALRWRGINDVAIDMVEIGSRVARTGGPSGAAL